MKAKAPEKIYIQRFDVDEEKAKFDKSKLFFDDIWTEEPEPILKTPKTENIEYTRTDAFIEKACEFLFQYNKNQVLKHGVKATLSCVEYTINVDEFRKYMEGE